MPVADEATMVLTEPRVHYLVRTSLVMDVLWALVLHDGEPDPDNYPMRAGRFVAAPGLEERIGAFWDDGEACFTELFVVAERGGVLDEDDPDRLLAGLEVGAAAEAGFEQLSTEAPEDQAIFRRRLARLRDDVDLRRAWIELVRDVWSAVSVAWELEGRPAVDAYAWDLRGKFAQCSSYTDLEGLLQCDFNGMLPRVVREYSAAGLPVVVVPAWLARKVFVIGLGDRLLIGHAVPARPIGPTAETRSRARRFKALGDPTRLAILEATARRPRTVGELAAEMGVAQPTVSNHVRILRDSGILTQVKDSARRLEPDPEALQRLADELLCSAIRPAR
jgi:DNA-binding transcriptional ArsR family regulator